MPASPLATTVANPRLIDVVKGMVRFATQAVADPAHGAVEIKALVDNICRDVASGDYASEALAIYHWVCTNIRYIRDPYDVEYVKEPAQTLKMRSGDCDDIAVCLAALLMAAGNKVSFALAAFSTPPAPSHVYVVLHTPKGDVPLDPVANRVTGQMLGRTTKLWLVPIQHAGSSGTGPKGDAY